MESLVVKSNKSKRTFTIRKYVDGKFFSKFRTLDFSKDEFEELDNNTEEDWKNFLRTDNSYTVVK